MRLMRLGATRKSTPPTIQTRNYWREAGILPESQFVFCSTRIMVPVMTMLMRIVLLSRIGVLNALADSDMSKTLINDLRVISWVTFMRFKLKHH